MLIMCNREIFNNAGSHFRHNLYFVYTRHILSNVGSQFKYKLYFLWSREVLYRIPCNLRNRCKFRNKFLSSFVLFFWKNRVAAAGSGLIMGVEEKGL